MNMKATQTPKGVWLSTAMMSAPLLTMTGYLAVMAPMAANAAMVDPANFAFVARSCLRLLSLNIAFLGGVHYGLGAATYDTARSEEERKAIEAQLAFSFVPAVLAGAASSFTAGDAAGDFEVRPTLRQARAGTRLVQELPSNRLWSLHVHHKCALWNLLQQL